MFSLFPARTLVLLWAFAFVLLTAISAEHLLTPVTPTWDIAADMLLQNQLRDHGLLLTGHYSRWEFNHPGPFWFYYNQLAERVLQSTGLSRVQIWHWGSVLINSLLLCFIAVAITALSGIRRPLWISGLILALIVGFVGPDITGIWMPDRLITPYAAFLVSLPFLARGELRFLPVSVFLVCILVHGYVTMPVLTLPLLAGACFLAWRARGGWQAFRANKASLFIAALIAGLFILPLVLNYLWAAPSNLEKIFAAQSSFGSKDKPSFAEFLSFLQHLLFRDHGWQWGMLGGTLLICMLWGRHAWQSPALRHFWLLLLTTTILVFGYYSRTPAPLFAFIAKFYLAVPALAVAAMIPYLAVSTTDTRLRQGVLRIALSSLILIMLWPSLKLEAVDRGEAIQSAADYAIKNSDHSPIALDYTDHYLWPYIAGLLLELDRQGVEACTTWEHMAFLYTQSQICNDEMPDYTLVLPDECKGDCGFRTETFGVRPFRLQPLHPGETVKHSSAKLFLQGWQGPEARFSWTQGTESAVVFTTDAASFRGKLTLNVDVLGEQRLFLTLNGQRIYEGTVTGNQQQVTASFDPALLSSSGGNNTLTLDVPDAKSPQGPDKRILAIALYSLTFN